MPILTLDELVKKNAEIIWDSNKAKSMDDFVFLLKEMEPICDYIIIQNFEENLRPTNDCFAIGNSSIISFKFGDNLPDEFEIIPFKGRVKSVKLRKFSLTTLERAMIEITLDTDIISIKTDVSILDPVARKICFRIAGSVV